MFVMRFIIFATSFRIIAADIFEICEKDSIG